ncbi:hypothetical protein [Pararhodobacter zhoushanensis]|uniref:hypothetical protein n=1 Tax=Pararhodobacter zhoushanensis TaxID=2479545 RepID=UPI000F8EE071|nr:hypothetical protein [Pararhodobacter zhoushanensis]
MNKIITTGAVLAGLTLAGCGEMPDMRGRMPHLGGGGMSEPISAGPTTMAPASSNAEQACMAAGSNAGFNVQGVVGTHEVTGADGMAVSRDVMLDVDRSGQSLQVRCSYAYDTASARIMTL